MTKDETVYNVVFTIGQNVGSRKRWGVRKIERVVRKRTGLQNYTAIKCRGLYGGMREPSVRFEVFGVSLTQVHGLYSALMKVRTELRQESIHFDAVKSEHAPEFIEEGSTTESVLRLIEA